MLRAASCKVQLTRWLRRQRPPAAPFQHPSPLQDFLAALPVRCYTEPRLGGSALNVATALRPRDNPTDLGPKCYIAYGRVAEAQGEGDSVTKVHNDMTGGCSCGSL